MAIGEGDLELRVVSEANDGAIGQDTLVGGIIVGLSSTSSICPNCWESASAR